MATYLDHAATTPMRRSAIDAMAPFQDVMYANPSGSHRFAREARKAIDEARDDVASVIGCKPGEVIFTSGGTEGDNAAIVGAITKHGGIAVCSSAEHHAVLHCVEHHGGSVVPTTTSGTIDLQALENVLATATTKVSVVSVMAVNNEVGSITPLRDVARIVREHAPDAVLHTDAVQAACWVDLAEIAPLVDVLTLSSHKFGGPKGMGVMMQRSGIELDPLILGGGQERDRRSGTHNVAGIVATAVALRETSESRVEETERVTKLRDRLVDDIRAQVADCLETVPREQRVPGIAHLCFADVENESLLFLLDEQDVFASAASACASGAMEPSHVLAAMGIERRWSKGSLRMSLGHTTSDADVDHAIRVVVGAVQHLRK